MYNETPRLSPEEILEYLRKSRADDALLTVEEVLAKHETILNEWVDRNIGSPIPEENKYREVVSGETINDRPEMKELLKRIENPRIKAILVVEVQRLSRGDLEDAGRLIKLLRYTNTLVITPQKTYNLHDEYDRDMFERELKRGNEFLEYQKKIMNRGVLLSVSQGNYVGSIPPYGFSKGWKMEGKKKCPILIPDPDEAPVVQMIFDMYVNQNLGRVTIAKKLNDLGIKPRKASHWEQNSIKDMLENVHYIGKVRWNWSKTVNIVEDGEIKKTRPRQKMGDYLIYDGKHDPIVSEEIFTLAEQKRGKNTRQKPTTKVRNPLAGLLYCKKCGRAMSLRTYKRNGVERSAPRLICDSQSYCKVGSCLYDEMIDRVKSILKDCIADFDIRITNDASDSIKLHKKLIDKLERRLEALNKQEMEQWALQANPDESLRMPQHIFKQLNESLLQEKAEIQESLCKAYESMPNPVDYTEKRKTFNDALNALDDPNASAAHKNNLLKACIDRMDYYRDAPVRIKGVKGKDTGLSVGGNWSQPEIDLEVKLRL